MHHEQGPKIMVNKYVMGLLISEIRIRDADALWSVSSIGLAKQHVDLWGLSMEERVGCPAARFIHTAWTLGYCMLLQSYTVCVSFSEPFCPLFVLIKKSKCGISFANKDYIYFYMVCRNIPSRDVRLSFWRWQMTMFLHFFALKINILADNHVLYTLPFLYLQVDFPYKSHS